MVSIVFLQCSQSVNSVFLIELTASIHSGVIVTVVARVAVATFLEKFSFVGFYRKRPLIANISCLCLECWNFALTCLTIFLRTLQLLIVIMVYVGRFDIPILAKGMEKFGPIQLDSFPSIFRKNLLAVDAHRHPYLERLGMLVSFLLRFFERI